MDVDKMTRDELRAYAKQNTLAGYSKMNAPELRELVRQHAIDSEPYIGQIEPLPEMGVVTGHLTINTNPLDSLDWSMPPRPIELARLAYSPHRPSAQAYADSRTPSRKLV